MKFFLCAALRNFNELRTFAQRLNSLGHLVTSRWHDRDQAERLVKGPPYLLEELVPGAKEDWHDVLACDALIFWTEKWNVPCRGGRHVLLGAALALGKHVWLIGDPENAYQCLPPVQKFDNDESVFAHVYLQWTPAADESQAVKCC